MAVIMRYTLRLLTLDQLNRATALICALELIRQEDPSSLGSWPFEIGLWVGDAATPNRMGSREHDHPRTARAKTLAFQRDDGDRHPGVAVPGVVRDARRWAGALIRSPSFAASLEGHFESLVDERVLVRVL